MPSGAACLSRRLQHLVAGMVVYCGGHALALARGKLVDQLAIAEEAEHGHRPDFQLVGYLALLLEPGTLRDQTSDSILNTLLTGTWPR